MNIHQLQVVFRHRAKLFRLVQGKWKERGDGKIKILKNNELEKYRLNMKLDQVVAHIRNKAEIKRNALLANVFLVNTRVFIELLFVVNFFLSKEFF